MVRKKHNTPGMIKYPFGQTTAKIQLNFLADCDSISAREPGTKGCISSRSALCGSVQEKRRGMSGRKN